MKRLVLTCALIVASLAPSPARAGAEQLPYRQVEHQQRGPCCDHFKWRAYATDRAELRAVWERFNLRGDPPRIGFDRRVAVVAGTGGSSSCPPGIGSLRLNREERRIVVRIRTETGGQDACTADWVTNTFVLAVRRGDVPRGDLDIRVYRVSR